MFHLEIRARPRRAELAGSQSGTEVRIASKRDGEDTRDMERALFEETHKAIKDSGLQQGGHFEALCRRKQMEPKV